MSLVPGLLAYLTPIRLHNKQRRVGISQNEGDLDIRCDTKEAVTIMHEYNAYSGDMTPKVCTWRELQIISCMHRAILFSEKHQLSMHFGKRTFEEHNQLQYWCT